jgi:hypothetical protein
VVIYQLKGSQAKSPEIFFWLEHTASHHSFFTPILAVANPVSGGDLGRLGR